MCWIYEIQYFSHLQNTGDGVDVFFVFKQLSLYIYFATSYYYVL